MSKMEDILATAPKPLPGVPAYPYLAPAEKAQGHFQRVTVTRVPDPTVD